MFPPLLPPSPRIPSPRLSFRSNSLNVSSFDLMYIHLLETSSMWSHGISSASKNEMFSELEPLDRGGSLGSAGGGGSNDGNVVMWIFPCQRLWRRISS
ncbi:hypothetical protein Bca101_007549 [Brassica carinata]